MEVDYWTSATVTHARQLPGGSWEVTVRRGDKDRIFKPKQLIFAIGVGGGTPNMPKIPGMVRDLLVDNPHEVSLREQEKFKGQILHSTQHNKATDHAGKKVVVVGACTSGAQHTVEYTAQC